MSIRTTSSITERVSSTDEHNPGGGKRSGGPDPSQGPPFLISNAHEENTFTRCRGVLHEYAAEFFGTMVLVVLGVGGNCQVGLSSNTAVSATPAGSWMSLAMGWGAAVAVGVWISGGHINPAVTLALAVWRGFSWKKVPGYMLAQLLGGIVGGAIVYANYFHAIDLVEGGRGIRTLKTAGLFATYPAPYMTAVSCFFSELLGTALLMMTILALTDKKNNIPTGFVPIGLFIIIYAIGACLGLETGFALNPARDFGPRIITSAVGYGGQVYTTRNEYWLWCPIIATSVGAQIGALCYDLFLYSGSDGLVLQKLGPRSPVQGGRSDSPAVA